MSGMHMLLVYYTTTNTRKRKKMKTQSQIACSEKEHEKFLKKMGIRTLVDASVGSEQRSSKPWVTGSSPVESVNKRSVAQSGSASGLSEVQILSDQYGLLQRKRRRFILETEIIGIAQMHKSNAVPVRGKKQATEVVNEEKLSAS